MCHCISTSGIKFLLPVVHFVSILILFGRTRVLPSSLVCRKIPNVSFLRWYKVSSCSCISTWISSSSFIFTLIQNDNPWSIPHDAIVSSVVIATAIGVEANPFFAAGYAQYSVVGGGKFELACLAFDWITVLIIRSSCIDDSCKFLLSCCRFSLKIRSILRRSSSIFYFSLYANFCCVPVCIVDPSF